MPVQLPATEEARSTHWSSADRPSALRLASPHLPIEFQGLRLRPDHTLPTATRSHSHACPALPFERSHAESSARRSTANSVGAVHLSDIAVRSPPLARSAVSLPVMCRNRRNARSELQVSATVRFERRVASFRTKASTSVKSRSSQWCFVPRAVARGSHARSRHRAPASFPRPHCVLADNGNTPPVTVTVVAHVYRATAAMAYPARPTRKPTREAHCWRGCGYSLELCRPLSLRSGISASESPHPDRGQVFGLE